MGEKDVFLRCFSDVFSAKKMLGEFFLQRLKHQRLDWGRDGLHFHDSPEDKTGIALRFCSP